MAATAARFRCRAIPSSTAVGHEHLAALPGAAVPPRFASVIAAVRGQDWASLQNLFFGNRLVLPTALRWEFGRRAAGCSSVCGRRASGLVKIAAHLFGGAAANAAYDAINEKVRLDLG